MTKVFLTGFETEATVRKLRDSAPDSVLQVRSNIENVNPNALDGVIAYNSDFTIDIVRVVFPRGFN